MLDRFRAVSETYTCGVDFSVQYGPVGAELAAVANRASSAWLDIGSRTGVLHS